MPAAADGAGDAAGVAAAGAGLAEAGEDLGRRRAPDEPVGLLGPVRDQSVRVDNRGGDGTAAAERCWCGRCPEAGRLVTS